MSTLDTLLTRLARADIRPAADELADALWLARQMYRCAPSTPTPRPAEPEAKPPPRPETPPPSPPPPREPKSEPNTDLFPDAPARHPGVAAQPLRAPAVPLLPDSLDLGRALRLLRRKVPSRLRRVLDEEASVQHIAATGLWQPCLRGKPERWYELVLLVDHSESMQIWMPTLRALRRLLEREGAFRTVRVWYFGDAAAPQFYSGADFHQARRPDELIDPTGRRLLLVISDCTAQAWHSGRLPQQLADWSRKLPLALVQLLPPRLWPGTALGYGEAVHFRAAGALTDNRALHGDGEETTKRNLKLPVVNLEPDSLQRWARLVIGRGETWVSGVVLDVQDIPAGDTVASGELTPQQRLRAFLQYASPPARRLAACLAAAPLTLPVMRLVQQQMLPESRLTHLAEVFLSPLLEPRAPGAEPVVYDFYPGVRDKLLNMTDVPTAKQVLDQVSRYVSAQWGKPLDFHALVRDPHGKAWLAEAGSLNFAEIGARVLRRMGGEYRRLAEGLVPAYVAGCRDRLADGSPGPAMVWLRGGTFVMGDDNGYSDEKPAHAVTLDDFSIGQYPVTFAEYDRFCVATGRKKPEDDWGRDRHPVYRVSWEDAHAYCEWLSAQTGRSYRLLTEAEWEFACRAGTVTQYYFGDDEKQLGEYAWYLNNAKRQTHPVGEKPPNPWGLYDMHGNVWEWVQDWFAKDYYQHSPPQNPQGPEAGSLRVCRGGSWRFDASRCRSAFRIGLDPADRRRLGFRLARTGPLHSYPDEPDEPVNGKLTAEQEIVDHLADGSTGPEMVYVPGGTFRMGSVKTPAWELGKETPAHEVTLDHFAAGKYPVTVGEYLRFARDTQSHWPEWLEKGSDYHVYSGKKDYYKTLGDALCDEDCPIVGVSWEDATAYCEWLSRQTGETYTLLSEAEWEYACRAGSKAAYGFGEDEKLLGDYAWYGENAQGRTHPVGEKQPNGFGLYDMHGNVWEWVQDWYGEYSEEPQISPEGPGDGSSRVLRGGAWLDVAGGCRAAFRGHLLLPGGRDHNTSFRLARRIS